jgi:hypothetical protein
MSNASRIIAVFSLAALGCGSATQTTAIESRTTMAGAGFQVAAPIEATPQAGVAQVEGSCAANATEGCNALDDDCDGRIDEGCGWETGSLQISAAWSTGADIDLYVTEPSGFRISNLSDASPSGGRLDHDARGACVSGGDAVENVLWPGAAPTGEYLVEVHYWGSCGTSGPTEVTVSVAARGSVVGVYRISLSEGQRLPVVVLPL